ncbi:MAG: phosphatidylserine decarboxylase [Opitutales bacterium]|nr:phosphatidylserine decarboxylase [Opitutales bacterium]
MAVKIYNPLTKKIEVEDVCQEAFLRFLYGNFFGKFLLWALFKRAIFSRAIGVWANMGISKSAARKFAKNHNIRIADFKKSPEEFKSFNDFFTREIRPETRPVSEGENDISFPADARNLAIENIQNRDVFFAKGQRFNLAEFLGGKELAARFEGGSMLISRLCPLDYHRFHYPVSGRIAARREIGGFLYSVNPIALSKSINYLCQNKRVLTIIELESGKMCAIVEIGATNVGSIVNFDKVGGEIRRGELMGMFKFGGSCIVSIFEKGTAKFSQELIDLSSEPIEYLSTANSKAGELLQ